MNASISAPSHEQIAAEVERFQVLGGQIKRLPPEAVLVDRRVGIHEQKRYEEFLDVSSDMLHVPKWNATKAGTRTIFGSAGSNLFLGLASF